MHTKARNLDKFKIFVLFFLILALILLILRWNPENSRTISQSQPDTMGDDDGKGIEEEQAVQFSYPPTPESDVALILDKEKLSLKDKDGQVRYGLDKNLSVWVPAIPDILIAGLPKDYFVVEDESKVWYIRYGSGKALYSLDNATLEWIEVQDEGPQPEKSAEAATSLAWVMDCPGANPARISGVGAKVIVVNALIPLRSSPSALGLNIIQPLPAGTQLEVISLPTCVPFLNGANIWWGVRTEHGETGFAAESSAIGSVYYLEEVK